MRFSTLSAVAAIAIAVAACSDSGDNSIATDVNLTQDNSADAVLGADNSTAALPTDAQGFAAAVAASDRYEIESSTLAAEKGASAAVKSAAERIRADHEKSSAELKSVSTAANVTVTPALDAEKQAMIRELEGAKGADFDRMYLDQQTRAHAKALQLLQNYAGGGDNEQLKAFASKTASVVQGHLEHLNGIRL